MNFPVASYSFLFKYPIWKVHHTTIKDHLIVETRDAKLRKIALYSVHTASQNLTELPAYPVLEKWWSTLEACIDGILLFSEYIDPNLPKPSGVKAFSLNHTNMLWEIPAVTLQKVYNEVFTVINKNNKTLSFDYKCKEVAPDHLSEIKSQFHHSHICSPENIIYQDFLIFLEQNALPLPVTVIEYYETNIFLILSYAYQINSHQKYKLLIFDASGKKQVDEDIFKNNKGFIDACFFIFGKSVLFLDNDYCLKGYEIT